MADSDDPIVNALRLARAYAPGAGLSGAAPVNRLLQDPALQTGPFPQWPTLSALLRKPTAYLEQGDRWRAPDPAAPEPTPLGIAMALLGAKGGMRSGIRMSTLPGRRWSPSGWIDDPATHRLQLESDQGRLTGIVNPSARSIRAGGSYVNEDARGQGHGLALYQALADRAGELGYTMHSDGPVSRDAARVYEALGRRGYDVRMHPDAVIDAGGNVGVRGGDPEANAYTIYPTSDKP